MKKYLIVGLSVTVGVVMGSLLLPAIAAPVNPSATPAQTLPADTAPPTSTDAAPSPTQPVTHSESPEPTETADQTAIAKGHIWFQIASLWNQLCIGQAALFDLEMKVAHYQAANQTDIANSYQALLTEKQNYISQVKAKVQDLTNQLGNPPAFASLQDALSARDDDTQWIGGMLAAAQAGRDNAEGMGITDDVWVAQINALEQAQALFGQ